MSTTQAGAASADVITFHVSIPLSLIGPLVSAFAAAAASLSPDPRIDQIVATMKELKTMSGTFSTDLATQTANLADLSDAMTTGFAANDRAIQDLKDKIAAGGAVSAADLATFEANNAAIKTAADGIRAHLVPVTSSGTTSSGTSVTSGGTVTSGGSATPVFNASDTTPNAPGGRNTSQLPGFDATLPETA